MEKSISLVGKKPLPIEKSYMSSLENKAIKVTPSIKLVLDKTAIFPTNLPITE